MVDKKTDASSYYELPEITVLDSFQEDDELTIFGKVGETRDKIQTTIDYTEAKNKQIHLEGLNGNQDCTIEKEVEQGTKEKIMQKALELEYVKPEIISMLAETLAPLDFIKKVKEIYDDFNLYFNQSQSAANTVKSEYMQQQNAELGYAKKLWEKAFAEKSFSCWGHSFLPSSDSVLDDVLMIEATKRFPDYDWDKIGEKIFYDQTVNLEECKKLDIK